MTEQALSNEGVETIAQRLDALGFEAETRRQLSAPSLRTFAAITDLWGINETQRRLILGSPARSTFCRWRKRAREHYPLVLPVETLRRISIVLGIHGALTVLFQNEREGVAWLKQPHSAPSFGGHPPMDLITDGTFEALITVQRFLNAARNGIYMPPDPTEAEFRPYDDREIIFKE